MSEQHCDICICSKRAPVQADSGSHLPLDHKYRPEGCMGPGSISWKEHLEAHSMYASLHRSEQSAERIAERGGFSYSELCDYLGHKPKTWEPR